MKNKTKIPIKKDSTLLREILQILSFLVILGYITLYFFDLTNRETVSLDFSFYKHLFLILLLITGLIVSFKNTLIAGLIYLLLGMPTETQRTPDGGKKLIYELHSKGMVTNPNKSKLTFNYSGDMANQEPHLNWKYCK